MVFPTELRQFFPLGRPYEVAHRNIYNVHQRVAASFRRNRVMLAGDAAHVNNPIGGLGMNFGIHDAVSLAASIDAVLNGETDTSLDAYDRVRRPHLPRVRDVEPDGEDGGAVGVGELVLLGQSGHSKPPGVAAVAVTARPGS